MMSMFKLETGEPSSNLAKGIDKEKEIAHDLRLRNPTASITRTSKTGDGGKDIIIEWGDKTIYHEVKNWERPMSVHDIRPYIKLHESSSAEVKIFNQGGFSKSARQTADTVGIELTAGSNYQSPGLQQVLRWLGVRYTNKLKLVFTGVKETTFEAVWRVDLAIKRTLSRSCWWLARRISGTGKWTRKRLSLRHLSLLGMIFGPVWLFIRWQDDESTHRELIEPITLFLISLALYSLLED